MRPHHHQALWVRVWERLQDHASLSINRHPEPFQLVFTEIDGMTVRRRLQRHGVGRM
jgi:hypothetical protein